MRKVIVIDDESDVRRYLMTLLEDNDYRTYAAASSEEGFRQVKKEHPDLICLDIMMPQESGIGLYKKLKSDPECKSIPVLLISAISREKEFNFADFIADGALPDPVGYMEKPIKPENFIDTIKKIIG
jgi:two-component system phosphate regulon response regulator PhoB